MTELSVPTNRRERFLAALPLPQRRTETADSDPLLQLLFRVLGGTPTRCVTHRDRDQDGRERLLAMLYAGSGDTPFAIGKVQSDLRNGSLQPEADALARVRTILPEPLLASVPQVLHMHASDEGEVLVTSFLPGRSAWFEMQASLLPSLRVAAHFADAARWLGDFHAATHRGGDVTASHGDFWAHNVLSDPKSGRVGVIDWENFSESSSRFVDLFQYPLTYGIGFPWRRYRALDAESAFAKTFFEENRVSAAVRAYFVSYCTRTGVAASRLRAAFREYLAGPHTLPGLRPLPWPRFLAQFDAARESVFS